MQILNSIDPAATTGKTKAIFEGVQKHLGLVPNMMRVIANSPAALNAYISFDGALGGGKLSAREREQIAVAVANANACDYCLSAHTLLGTAAGLNATELSLARDGASSDARTAALLQFVTRVVRQRGQVPPSEVEALQAAGYTAEEIVETIAAIAVNIFTNYFNNIVGTEIDFPIVRSASAR
jgi:uncharacterized peroxidase-related enzyme